MLVIAGRSHTHSVDNQIAKNRNLRTLYVLNNGDAFVGLGGFGFFSFSSSIFNFFAGVNDLLLSNYRIGRTHADDQVNDLDQPLVEEKPHTTESKKETAVHVATIYEVVESFHTNPVAGDTEESTSYKDVAPE